MIFDHIGVYCDWLMDQGVECNLLQTRENRDIATPLPVAVFLRMYDGKGSGVFHEYTARMLEQGDGCGAGELAYSNGNGVIWGLSTFGDGDNGQGDGNGISGLRFSREED